jgi:hypothetical protein|tara:strand:+ start:755 stop:1072 length:318 start_codon:yes stop_codon:yes gene_type:complete
LKRDAERLNIQLPAEMFEPETFAIWPEHLDVLEMFLRCQTQWRSGANGVIGLDYGVVLELCRLYDVQDRKQLLNDLQVMEGRALQLIAEAAEKQQKAARRKARKS